MLSLNPLIQWFQQQARELPWRTQHSPYRVWISEIMLQQTQVSVVIPYFEKWMNTFPTIEALASAPLDQVIKLWEGLGYYSRARNIHHTAQTIVNEYGGIFPNEKESLKKLKGLGPYTIGAILSFAFHKKEPAVDGNVLRVMSRLFAIEDPIDSLSTRKQITHLLENLLPDNKPWIANEALIELGALICTKKPNCVKCPLRSCCRAYQNQNTELFPVKINKVTTHNLFRLVAVIYCDNHLLLRKVGKGKVMSDLYEFPYIENDGWSLSSFIENHFGLTIIDQETLPLQKHAFTRFRVELTPTSFEVKNKIPVEGYQWYSFEKVSHLPFSAGHRRILSTFKFAS